MSVRANKRKASQMEFINSAHELEMYTIRLSVRENAIPKRYRYILGKPLCDAARRLNQYVIYANSIYPKIKGDYELRSHYQQMALAELQNIFELMRIVSELLPIKGTVLSEWTGIARKEDKALRSWIASDKTRYQGL